MTIRQTIKYWLYSRCPGFAGAFTYFGTRVYFPRDSIIFRHACEQDVFEIENVRLLQNLVRPGSCFFDVGANIGLMSIPVLQGVSKVTVVSFEPSPNTLPWLLRTIEESSYPGRWTLVAKAVGATIGEASFSVSNPGDGAYDGIKSTHRVNEARQVTVEVTTIDQEWEKLGRPEVSVMKIDVEGGELAVLQGATQLLKRDRPYILLEWNPINIKPYGVDPRALLDFALTNGWLLLALPHMNRMTTLVELKVYMTQTESFLLLPNNG